MKILKSVVPPCGHKSQNKPPRDTALVYNLVEWKWEMLKGVCENTKMLFYFFIKHLYVLKYSQSLKFIRCKKSLYFFSSM